MGRFRNGYLRKCMNRSLPMWRKGQVSLGRSHLSDPRGGRLLHKEPQSMLLLGFKKGTTIETRFYVVLRLVLNFVGKGAPGPRTVGPRPAASSHGCRPGHRFQKLSVTLPRLELEREVYLADSTENRAEASVVAALESEVSLESGQAVVLPV